MYLFRGPRFARCLALLIASCIAPYAMPAPFISEVFLDSTNGHAIEISGIDPTRGATLVIADANRFASITGFGGVLDAFYLTPEVLTPSPVELISESPWPSPINHRLAGTVDSLRDTSTLSLNGDGFDRLLLLYEGMSTLVLGDTPAYDTAANDRHSDPNAPMVDYLLLGVGDPDTVFNHSVINAADTALGTDLLTRSADRTKHSVIARTNLPDQPIDLDRVYAGNLDPDSTFAVDPHYLYYATPGTNNLELLNVAPEPGSLALLVISAGVCLRRRAIR